MPLRHATLPTSLGDLLVVADADGLTGIYFPGHWHPPSADSIGLAVDAASEALFMELGKQLAEYLDGRRTVFDLPTAAAGDAFEEAVWAMLREIPYGATTTYGELAVRLGDRNLARRVGYAVGHNPLSILVPCHRVVGASGSLTGYAGGLERKQLLLELEGAEVVAQRRLF
ncbi:methylated-DNA--[protein]-cysteine S-methyltransferase [Agromyces albus]|uniref:Methylated-DNA--protein-cysteine methyltransferase n=1 Tax=Agromyces albus TaxID=205332 RepID=A0A4Q2KW19_9MICO|nr:methylated-DNA--[protein]-cysteine S-methyltransferase [Agromyces albus]RXZ68022.1 methylated-DNA--[protein]-cysteine S-methyltransferase [Agromyces albus]